MSADRPPPLDLAFYEKKAKSWDRWTTIIILGLLLIPLPFARFEAWPGGTVLAERLVMPWSHFRLCYTDFPSGDIVEEAYHFTWKGKLIAPSASSTTLFVIISADPPLLKWQNAPPLPLDQLFLRGDLLKMETFWQPVLFWPFEMGWRMYSQR